MTQIDSKDMEVAELSNDQFNALRQAEQKINDTLKNKQEVYLLAVIRH
jgi:hypothetical protein